MDRFEISSTRGGMEDRQRLQTELNDPAGKAAPAGSRCQLSISGTPVPEAQSQWMRTDVPRTFYGMRRPPAKAIGIDRLTMLMTATAIPIRDGPISVPTAPAEGRDRLSRAVFDEIRCVTWGRQFLPAAGPSGPASGEGQRGFENSSSHSGI